MITICRAGIDDAPIVAEIGRQSFIESHGHSGSMADIEAYVAEKYTLEVVREDLNNAQYIYHLIFYHGRAAGYSRILLHAPHPLVAAGNVTCLDRLYLLREFYGLGLGLALHNHNITIARQAHQAGMWLYTWIGNTRAIAFYEKAGFRIVGKTDFRISENHVNPNHVMYLDFGA